MNSGESLAHSYRMMMAACGHPVDDARLASAIATTGPILDPQACLWRLCVCMGQPEARVMRTPDAAHLPLIALIEGRGWGIVDELGPDGRWRFLQEGQTDWVDTGMLALVARPGDDRPAEEADADEHSFSRVMRRIAAPYRGLLAEAAGATVIVNVMALAASLFSMQVYDRVIPTRSDSTLVILAVGVALVIAIELALKIARGKIMDSMVVGMDSAMSRKIFEKLLGIRMDQLPGSVGSLAAQVRGYEQIRSFYTASSLFTLVDFPSSLLFLLLIAFIGSPWIAVPPAIMALLGISAGLMARRRMQRLATEGARVSSRKTGLLVEAVEGVETIKSGSGGWKFLSRWLDASSKALEYDLKTRHSSDVLGYANATFQQLAYALMIAVGAVFVMHGDITTGALVACSILGGRVLAPVMAIPGLIVQHSHARAAAQSLDKLFALESDNHGVARPLSPANLHGHYLLEQTSFTYPGAASGLAIDRLEIRAGERIGILGSIGSGKSTLLRILAGLYQPSGGRVYLDGLELRQIHRQVVSRDVGYLQQEHRLFEGTLRENLLIGMADPGDDAMRAALVRTGLMSVVAAHPRGLELPIQEGGKGLSGGQRQLVAFTRLVLSRPTIMLLDEPTASMDEMQERRCLEVLRDQIQPWTTFVLVTHKTSMLPLVDRLIVVANGRIVMDGPRQKVLAALESGQRPAPAAAPAHAQREETARVPVAAAMARAT